MADDIRPTQPSIPSPLVSPPPEHRRRQKKDPQQENAEEADNDKPNMPDDGKGGQLDEYV